MRTDVYLKLCRLVNSRNAAKQMCDSGGVLVNGQAAKSSRELHVGDQLEICGRSRNLTVKVLGIPMAKQVSKADAHIFYEILKEDHPDRRESLTT